MADYERMKKPQHSPKMLNIAPNKLLLHIQNIVPPIVAISDIACKSNVFVPLICCAIKIHDPDEATIASDLLRPSVEGISGVVSVG